MIFIVKKVWNLYITERSPFCWINQNPTDPWLSLNVSTMDDWVLQNWCQDIGRTEMSSLPSQKPAASKYNLKVFTSMGAMTLPVHFLNTCNYLVYRILPFIYFKRWTSFTWARLYRVADSYDVMTKRGIQWNLKADCQYIFLCIIIWQRQETSCSLWVNLFIPDMGNL